MQYFLFVTVSFLWGINFILMKNAVGTYTPIGVAAIRVLSGAVFLSIVVLWRERRWPFQFGDAVPLGLIVILGYSWPFFIQPHLIQFCGSGVIGLMPSLVPLVTIIISVPMLGIWPSMRQLIGVMVGLTLIAFLFLDGVNRNIDTMHLLLAVTVPLSYAISNTLVKRRFSDVSPVVLTFFCLAVTSAILIPCSLLEGDAATERFFESDQMISSTICAIWLGVLGTGIALLFFTIMLQQRGPLFAGMVTYIIPVIALCAGGLDGEHVSWLQIASLAGILAMVAVVQWPIKNNLSMTRQENSAAES